MDGFSYHTAHFFYCKEKITDSSERNKGRILRYPVKGVIKMSDKILESLPMGFGMALLQNKEARDIYDVLPINRQIEIINGTHNIRSKKEMQAYVAGITALQ